VSRSTRRAPTASRAARPPSWSASRAATPGSWASRSTKPPSCSRRFGIAVP
jgi:hypothetical protein